MHHEPAADSLERILVAIPPASGALVMGTGIVSIALSLDHLETLSRILLVIAGIVWIALGLLLATRILRDRDRVHREARSPAALTGVAGTAVLGTRLVLLGWSWAGVSLLVIAVLFWLTLLIPVLRNWVTPTVGVSLMLTVSTESLAVLSATLAAPEHAGWLLYAALAPFLLGLAFYLFVISRFDPRQLVIGRGDHWITGGALAISTLAAGRITLDADALHTLNLPGALKTISVVLWALTIAWLPALLLAETLRPRPGYDGRRWSTVFPVGMYAACSFGVGAAAKAPAIKDFGRVWVWAGAAVWLVVFAAMLRRARQFASGTHPPLTADRVEELAPSKREATNS